MHAVFGGKWQPEVLAAELLDEGGEAVAGHRVRNDGRPRVLPAHGQQSEDCLKNFWSSCASHHAGNNI